MEIAFAAVLEKVKADFESLQDFTCLEKVVTDKIQEDEILLDKNITENLQLVVRCLRWVDVEFILEFFVPKENKYLWGGKFKNKEKSENKQTNKPCASLRVELVWGQLF